jgi:hypothetical protein
MNNNNNQQNINPIEPVFDSQLTDFVRTAVDLNRDLGVDCKCKFVLGNPNKTSEELKIISEEATSLFNRLINGRTEITPAQVEVVKRCLWNKSFYPNRITDVEGHYKIPEKHNLNNMIMDNEFIKPLISEDIISTDMSNMLLKQIDISNINNGFICVIGLSVTIGFFLLYKLLKSDEGFSSGFQCFRTDDYKWLIKGGLVLKTGYDCDDCSCGSSCYCCCGHDRDNRTPDDSPAPGSWIPSTPEEKARRAQWWAQQEVESGLVKAKRVKKDDEARAKLMEWRKKALEAQAEKAAKKAAEKAASEKKADVPLAWGLYFQDGASPSFEGIVDLHNRIMFYLVFILFGVTWVMVSIMRNFNKNENKLVYRYLNHGTLIELIWTVGPALVLVAIAFPSFKLLYLMDEVIDPAMTVKVTGLFGLNLYILYKIINTYNNINNIFYFIYLPDYVRAGSIIDPWDIGPRMEGENNKYYDYFKYFNFQRFNTNIVRAKNRIGPHNNDIVSVIIGSLLGDGHCNKRIIEGCRICIRQSSIHIEYLFWLYDFFYIRGYCSNLKPRLYTRKLKNYSNVYTGYEFNTYTFISFSWIYRLFYHKGKKRINKKLENYITSLSLAVWLMDDGGWTGYGVRISTNAFSYEEIIILTEILDSKFELKCIIQKLSKPKNYNKNTIYVDKYSIYIKSISVPLLRKLVLPYMHSSMLYKIGL